MIALILTICAVGLVVLVAGGLLGRKMPERNGLSDPWEPGKDGTHENGTTSRRARR